MFRKALIYFTLPLLLLIGISWKTSGARDKTPEGQTGTLEKMIVTRGNVVMDLDLNRLNGAGSETTGAKLDPLRFEVNPSSFFTILVFDHVLRGPEPGSMELIWDNSAALPELLNASANQLVVEKIAPDQAFDLVVRDGKTGFVFFNIEGHLYEYNAAARSLQIKDGRVLISGEFANRLGRPEDAGVSVGKISIETTMSAIEVTTVVNGAAQSSTLPSRRGGTPEVPNLVPGPDVIVGDLHFHAAIWHHRNPGRRRDGNDLLQ